MRPARGIAWQYTARMKLSLNPIGPILLFVGFLAVACGPSPTTYSLFTTDEGRFQAEFPTEPRREAVSVTAQGTDITLTLISFSSERTPTEAVSVSFVDYLKPIDEANRKGVLDGAATGAASTLSGTLASKVPTSYLGYEALDFVVNSASGRATARAFLVQNRMYLLQVVQTEGQTDSESYDRLLATFKVFLGPTPTPPPDEAAGASPGSVAPSASTPLVTSPAIETPGGVSPSLLYPFPQQP